jgi:glycylpeptide N-tetradecanoyltransferase
MFRFDYSTDFLYWHLSAPGFLKQYHLSVFKTGDDGVKHMIGFISAIPVHIYIDGKKRSKVEINFLCVNSAYRSHRLAPVLIKEITRRVNCNNTWQAVYTAGSLLPKPIAITNYYHRNLNLQKLLDVKFTYLNPKLNLARAKGIYKLAKETSITRIRAMEKKDVEGVYEILDNYLSKFKIRPYYSKEEVEHWFVPRKSIVYSYVIENDEGKITDFISFYLLPSSILQHTQHKTLYACYSFMNVPGQYSMKELMRNALILAKQLNFDVYNALNVMDNEPVFDDLLFGKGDGSLKYYFYNYLCPEVQPNELAIVLM